MSPPTGRSDEHSLGFSALFCCLTCNVWPILFSGVVLTGGSRPARDVTRETSLVRLVLGSCNTGSCSQFVALIEGCTQPGCSRALQQNTSHTTTSCVTWSKLMLWLFHFPHQNLPAKVIIFSVIYKMTRKGIDNLLPNLKMYRYV